MSSTDSPPDTPSDRKDYSFSSNNNGGPSSGSNMQPSMDDLNHLNSPPSLHSPQDYGIDATCMHPKLVKSLLLRKIIKISSGGVHNICIVEPLPNTVMQDVYQSFIQSKYTDVTFKGFYSTVDPAINQNNNNTLSQDLVHSNTYHQ